MGTMTTNAITADQAAAAGLTATRAMLARIDAQRTALLTHEAGLIVHQLAVRVLTDHMHAARILFNSHHPTSLQSDMVVNEDLTVIRAATDDFYFEITEALQKTAIAELARAAEHRKFEAHGIYASAAPSDGSVVGYIDLHAAAMTVPELPVELQDAATRPLSEAEQSILVSDAREVQDERAHRLGYIDSEEEFVSVRVDREATDAVLSPRRAGEHLHGDWIRRTVEQCLPYEVRGDVRAVELEARGDYFAPVRLLGADGEVLAASDEAVAHMVAEERIAQRLEYVSEDVPAEQLLVSGIELTETGMTVRFD